MVGTTSEKSTKVANKAAAKRVAAKPARLAGGNPQIAKADGDAPVQAYIAAMPGWKRDIGRRLDVKEGGSEKPEPPSRLIDARIKELPDWRGEVLSRIRRLIKQADPEVVEEWKWRGVPVWSHDGMLCTGETYKNVVKLTFAKGASLKDPAGLFNSSLEGNARRAIDLHEGDEIDERAFKSLVCAAAALNASSASSRRMPSKAKPQGAAGKGERSTATKGKGPSVAAKPARLAAGNP